VRREEKIAKARELRERGLSYRHIGERLGVTNSCVAKWLNPERTREWNRRSEAKPERKAAKRAHEKQSRAMCACGNPMGQGSGYPGYRYNQCDECRVLEERERVDERAQRIVAWWAEGETLKQIASRLGWTVGHLSQEFDRLRGRGYELPYRRKSGTKNATAYPEQVAS
jgi:transposase